VRADISLCLMSANCYWWCVDYWRQRSQFSRLWASQYFTTTDDWTTTTYKRFLFLFLFLEVGWHLTGWDWGFEGNLKELLKTEKQILSHFLLVQCEFFIDICHVGEDMLIADIFFFFFLICCVASMSWFFFFFLSCFWSAVCCWFFFLIFNF
jgi:hypothetical protein